MSANSKADSFLSLPGDIFISIAEFELSKMNARSG